MIEDSNQHLQANSDITDSIVIPPEVMEAVVKSLGDFFEPLNGINPTVLASDHLDLAKSIKRAEVLQRYTILESKKLLEIGSGYGTNLAVWIKQFNVNAWGVEPDSTGFASSILSSHKLLKANGIDPERLVNATGENLPFENESFDIVYSAYVLEHTMDPERVLTEGARVLRRGGIMLFEIPNFLSYFEGHYMIVQPPIIWKPLLSIWVSLFFHRDPSLAQTLRTEINPLWCRKAVRRLNRNYKVKLLSLGEDIFLERLSHPFAFEAQGVASKLNSLMLLMQRLNFNNWISRLIILLQGHYPIYLVLQRSDL